MLGFYCKRVYLVPKQIRLLSVYLYGYILVILLFTSFVVWNGSIVVGDKSAHEAAMHIPQVMIRFVTPINRTPRLMQSMFSPQIFYFSLFSLVFGPSIAMHYLTASAQTFRSRWYLLLPMTVAAALFIYSNTIVHPYMLADNRHYTFYVWNKFYGRYEWARYSLIPIYMLGLATLSHALANKSAGFILIYSACTFVSIALQQLIELRYFIIPFLVLRLHMAAVKSRWILFELIVYCAMNAIVFYLFATKEIYWQNYDYVQRLIW